MLQNLLEIKQCYFNIINMKIGKSYSGNSPLCCSFLQSKLVDNYFTVSSHGYIPSIDIIFPLVDGN